ncbi:hypothetical protein AXG93_4683s1030 [Marchantia polymorpha subsp. ruderalis]|uniref:Transmembrane protein n=1 Tax=Marchantia polymorpha subsp. ruderalis TaxID=1480154 RepID=A0A176VCX8_MARPO|nr:hypothetical protein AXG93_4683s1030 [Marchantia polymorpha subsp. ruderalis]
MSSDASSTTPDDSIQRMIHMRDEFYTDEGKTLCGLNRILVNQISKALRESVQLLIWIQFTLVLPAMLVFVCNLYNFLTLVPKLVPNADFPDADDATLARRKNYGLGILFGLAVAYFLLTINVLAAINYATGNIYKGHKVSFLDVLKALPGLWKGFLITTLWSSLLTYGALLVLWITASLTLYFSYQTTNGPFIVVMYMTTLFLLLAFVFVSTTFIPAVTAVANGVTCFEDCCGLKAFHKAMALLEDLWLMAFKGATFESISIRLVVIEIYMLSGFTGPSELEEIQLWTKLLVGGVMVLMLSIYMQASTMYWSLFYITCKIYHHESLEPRGSGQYERIVLNEIDSESVGERV